MLDKIKTDRDRIIRKLENEYKEINVRKLRYDSDNNTYCNYCKSNCHINCMCYLSFLILCNECIIFPGLSDVCKKCGHRKYEHTIRENKKWVNEREIVKVDNEDKIERVNDRYWDKYYEINDDYNRKISNKNNQLNILKNLCKTQIETTKKKNIYNNDKAQLNDDIKKIISEIKISFINLLDISKAINNTALNNFHFEIENEYIENLIINIQEACINQKIEIEGLNKIKCYNNFYLKIIGLSRQELDELNDEEIINKINGIIFNNSIN